MFYMCFFFFFFTGSQIMLQRLSLHPHRRQRHSDFWLQPPRVSGIADERSEFHLQRNQVLPPVQHQPVWGTGGKRWKHTHTQAEKYCPFKSLCGWIATPFFCLLSFFIKGSAGHVHRQCNWPIRHRLPERERWGSQLRQDLHLSVNNNPGERTRLPHGALLAIH